MNTGNWNPLDKFWTLFAPLLSPDPQASPFRLGTASPPIWDLPSVYGNLESPQGSSSSSSSSSKDGIPHFVNFGYFDKLAMEAKYPTVHHDPPMWMIMSNLNMFDWLVRVPLYAATGPAFAYGYSTATGRGKPNFYTLLTVTVTGLFSGLVVSHAESESRLQGFLENDSDVAYWKKRASIEKQIMNGDLNAADQLGFVQANVRGLFGPKQIDFETIEKQYYQTQNEPDTLDETRQK